MNTIVANQTKFIETIGQFEEWHDIWSYLITQGNRLPAECPKSLLPHQIKSCISRTHFDAWIEGDNLRVAGWSNSAVMRGIIVSIIEMFDMTPAIDLEEPDIIFFHTESGMIDNMTPLRRASLIEIAWRITVLYGSIQ